jgi:hypothetical protein
MSLYGTIIRKTNNNLVKKQAKFLDSYFFKDTTSSTSGKCKSKP